MFWFVFCYLSFLQERLSWWKEWAIDIAVSPNVLDNYRATRAIHEGYSKVLNHPKTKEVIQEKLPGIVKPQTIEKIRNIAEVVVDEIKSSRRDTNKKDTSFKDAVNDTLKDLANGKLPPLSENLINESIRAFTQDCFVELHIDLIVIIDQ